MADTPISRTGNLGVLQLALALIFVLGEVFFNEVVELICLRSEIRSIIRSLVDCLLIVI
jgi:hypothetical protein